MIEHKCLIISLGGTIAGKVASDKLDATDMQDATQFGSIMKATIDFLKEKHNTEIMTELHVIDEVDSSNIIPDHWIQISQSIKDKYDDYDSFIVTHGTNTMGYTSSALSYSLANLDKPVIVTGSQVPAGMAGSDAEINLNNALRVAVWSDQDGRKFKGVVAVFGSYIITGTRVKKNTEFDYDAFKSFGVSAIGRIGRIINVDNVNLDKHISYLSTDTYKRATYAKDLMCENKFNMSILSLTEFPGMSSSIFKTLVENEKIQGFVIRAFGAGDLSSHHIQALEYLKNLQIPVVITTQAPNGNSNFQVNEPGQYLKENGLAVPAYDMSIESMTVKLAWLLAKKDDNQLDYNGVCQMMTSNIRGDIQVLWEAPI